MRPIGRPRRKLPQSQRIVLTSRLRLNIQADPLSANAILVEYTPNLMNISVPEWLRGRDHMRNWEKFKYVGATAWLKKSDTLFYSYAETALPSPAVISGSVLKVNIETVCGNNAYMESADQNTGSFDRITPNVRKLTRKGTRVIKYRVPRQGMSGQTKNVSDSVFWGHNLTPPDLNLIQLASNTDFQTGLGADHVQVPSKIWVLLKNLPYPGIFPGVNQAQELSFACDYFVNFHFYAYGQHAYNVIY